MSADVTNSRRRPSAGLPPSESVLARRATPERKPRSATTDEVMDRIVSISSILLRLLFLASHGIVFIWIVMLCIFNEPDVVAVCVASTALVIAIVSYGVGFGLQCIATMVMNVSIFRMPPSMSRR